MVTGSLSRGWSGETIPSYPELYTRLVRIGDVYCKLEFENPSGSIKDRAAFHMLCRAEERGLLRSGGSILEVTSGNMGISMAMAASLRGYRMTAVMPEFVSIEKMEMMRGYGAKLVITPGHEDLAGALEEYERLKIDYPDAFCPDQFGNEDNVEAHRLSTGPELIAQMNGDIDAVVAGIGTGGTIVGIALALEDAGIDARVIGVEPAESSVISGGKAGPHSIQGIGEGFVPPIISRHRELIDEVVRVSSQDAVGRTRTLWSEGFMAGITSGANLLAAEVEARNYRRVATILPDSAERYFSLISR